MGNQEGVVGLLELKGDVLGVLHDLMAQSLQQKSDLGLLVEEADRMAILIDVEMGEVLMCSYSMGVTEQRS